MSVFDRIASRYDLGMLPLEIVLLRNLRRKLYSSLRGQVLELGTGTGPNLPLYHPSINLVASDMSAHMLTTARRRRMRAKPSWLQIDAQHLPFQDASFDIVTTSLLFCSVNDPSAALNEVKRVLRPSGWLISLEHVRGDAGLGRYLTDTLAAPWLKLSGTCHLDRETAETVGHAGFEIVSSRRHGLGIFQVIRARANRKPGL